MMKVRMLLLCAVVGVSSFFSTTTTTTTGGLKNAFRLLQSNKENRYGEGAVNEEEEAALEALVKERMAELDEGLRSGERFEPSMEEELSKRIAELPKAEQVASDRRVIENIFEVAQADVRAWGETLKKEQRQNLEDARARMDEEMAAQTRAFETQMDAVAREAGIDPRRFREEEEKEEVLAAAAILPDAPDEVLLIRSPWPPPLDAALAVVACDATVEALGRDVRAGLTSRGYVDVREEADLGAKVVVVLCDGEFRSTSCLTRATDNVASGGLVVAASRQGATRTGEFGFAIRNARGTLSRAREFEDALKFQTRQRDAAISYAVVRFGDIGKGTGPPALELGDALDSTCSIDVAADVLARTALCPHARNSTFAASGHDPAAEWTDLFLKLDGPELKRLVATARSTRLELVEWLHEWSTLWLGGGAGLTTPVKLETTDDGAKLLFLDRSSTPARRRPKNNGGVRFLVDADPDANLRVRALREPYDQGIAVKEMSETTILDKLARDFKNQWVL